MLAVTAQLGPVSPDRLKIQSEARASVRYLFIIVKRVVSWAELGQAGRKTDWRQHSLASDFGRGIEGVCAQPLVPHVPSRYQWKLFVMTRNPSIYGWEYSTPPTWVTYLPVRKKSPSFPGPFPWLGLSVPQSKGKGLGNEAGEKWTKIINRFRQAYKRSPGCDKSATKGKKLFVFHPVPGQRSISKTHTTSTSSKPGPAIWSHDTGQQIGCCDSCQLTMVWISKNEDVAYLVFKVLASGRTGVRTDGRTYVRTVTWQPKFFR